MKAAPPPPRPPPPPPPPPPSLSSSASASASSAAGKKMMWMKDPEMVWVQGALVQEMPDSNVELERNGKRLVLPKADVHEVNPSSSDDMTSLRYLHEAGILDNLDLRYKEKAIYTFMAAALLAVNPLQRIPHPSMTEYANGKGDKPHPYAIAETCYKNLLVLQKNQSVVINGESGAGKTETAKIVVKYLAERNRSDNAVSSAQVTGDQLYDKLSGVSPILESFGNAKTGRNSNSSRFGKFMKLNFLFDNGSGPKRKKSMSLIGATIETYLLEKSRVVHQSDGERNFHIFYSLLHDVPSNVVDNIDLRKYDFRIARGYTGLKSADLLEESHSLSSVQAALQTIGMSSQQISELWRILAALLFMGNIALAERDSQEGPIAYIPPSDVSTKHCASLLGVSEEELRLLCTQREMVARGEKFSVPLSLRDARFSRDAAAKAIYEAVFGAIVKQVNASLGGSTDADGASEQNAFIGVLDIFGFESFQKNGFEQLLINFANEALQNTFNRQIFEKEVALFEEEKIDFSMGECPTNKLCVDLISFKGESIFATLDTVSRQPQPSDERFCEEVHKLFTKRNPHFGAVHRKDMRSVFVILHYASDVKYSVGDAKNQDESWIVKNNDSTPDALEGLYAASTSSLLASFAPAHVVAARSGGAEGSGVPAAGPGGAQRARRRVSVMLKPTIVSTFSRSMDELNYLLDTTLCHFIRCIKPNPTMTAGVFNRAYVIEQVRALGVLQACAVLQVSLPTRIPYTQLKEAFRGTVVRVEHLFPVENDVLLISSLLRAYGIPADLYRLGATIAFFRPGQLAVLEKLLDSSSQDGVNDEIVQRIAASVTHYTQTMAAVAQEQQKYQQLSVLLNELEDKALQLTEEVREQVPEVEGLAMPDLLLSSIATIEKERSKLKARYTEAQQVTGQVLGLIEEKEWKRGEKAAVDTKVFALADSQARLLEAVNQQLSTALEQYTSLQNHITLLEEHHSRNRDAQRLHALVASNDSIYESSMDMLTKLFEALGLWKLCAERGDISLANTTADTVRALFADLQASATKFSRGIEEAQALLVQIRALDQTGGGVNFSEVEAEAQSVMDTLGEGLAKAAECIELKGKVTKAIAQVAIELANQARPLPMSPEQSAANGSSGGMAKSPLAVSGAVAVAGTAAAAAATAAAAAAATAAATGAAIAAAAPTSRSSVNFTLKDLKALKEKKVEGATLLSERPASTRMSLGGGTAAAAPAPSSLPEGWKELFDPKTNRPYYVNKELKLRQWNKPTPAETAQSQREQGIDPVRTTTGSASAESSTIPTDSSAAGEDSELLPKGWRACVDKKTQRTYYVNDETKARQWRRPENARNPTEEVHSERRMSRRVPRKSVLMAPPPPSTPSAPSVPTITPEKRKAIFISEQRQRSMAIINEEVYDEELDEDQMATVSYLHRIGAQAHMGYMSKQSKLLGRWRRRYFVLHKDHLMYFENEKEFDGVLHQHKGNLDQIHSSLKADKKFTLTGNCITYFTNTAHCFSLSLYSAEQAAIDAECEPWYLLCETDEEMNKWMKTLNGHVHLRFLEEHGLTTTDYWDEGIVQLSLWKVPPGNSSVVSRRPVGIRTVPRVDGPRTGEGLFPGECVEIVQILEQGGQRYLRLADDRGWVFENHPIAKYAILIPAGGRVVEEIAVYTYPAHFLESLVVHSSPQCTPESATDVRLKPGTTIRACAVWNIPAAILNCDPEDDMMLTFVKLNDGTGWVPMFHHVTGGQLLLSA